MSIVVPDVSKTALNWQLWRGSIGSVSTFHWKVHLYNSSVSLSASTVLTDLTAHEASFDTYAAQNLTFFFDNGIVSPDYSQYLFTPLLWTVGVGGGSDTIYGYWVDGDNAGSATQLLWCEALPSPVPMNVVGLNLGIGPRWEVGQI